MKMKQGIAVIGSGYWGRNIVRNLSEMEVLHTVHDINIERLDSIHSEFPSINTTSNIDEILVSNAINAVVIAAPAVDHYDLAKMALLSGKDVLVEKPLSLNIEEAVELVNIASEKKRILMVGHILQYHPAVIKLREMVESGDLGKIQYVYSNRLNIGKVRTEENILWSFAPHDISIILMLLGEEPINVTSFGGRYITRGIYDTTLTTMEFGNGVKGHVYVSWLHPFKEQKLIVVGTKAMAVFDDMADEKLSLYPHKIEYKGGKIPVAQKAEQYTVHVEEKEPLREELKHFIRCVEKREEPRTDGEEGLKVLRVLQRAESCLSSPDHLLKTQFAGEGCFVHESSFVDNDVKIGDGVKIWHFSHILKGSEIGKNCIIGQNVMIGPGVKIGDRCKIQNNVSIYNGIILEEDVFCGPSCVFTNVYNPRAFIERKNEFLPTLVKKGATIGANATIVCGITVGRFSLVSAGATVKKDVPDYALVVGVPAKQIGWVCRCGVTLKVFDGKNSTRCENCGSKYELQKNKLTAVEEMI
ncbi:MAG: Gfo/Idh/MocA family oxidoreductase [Candidatus Scalindua sp.]|jgi:UDP-2-acetamido-3-amino-2,3-dideoxy-glucuronate N-acetyltransferase|nr:Gfo/Idh/MocA family oxidoreductase [Candidatus Scalindua sp.]MBT6229996.1 Gfo/Idh/MocA family oxidoreductase [Candidatus Scalindua sp.]MBT6564825.1 Gfo/Idh/MocA family oxidoreductase [Candidatus Scalindua sp.]MBT7212516.1 Gfo/Idh/MocA family oxidoreductase [Candidatus Scalindua sp.]MBT7592185.1 Gfo/Idh/MocA family oxidoreductase [Candidatus Scalindua sp.]